MCVEEGHRDPNAHNKDLINTVNPRKLEHSLRRIHAGIPYTLL